MEEREQGVRLVWRFLYTQFTLRRMVILDYAPCMGLFIEHCVVWRYCVKPNEAKKQASIDVLGLALHSGLVESSR